MNTKKVSATNVRVNLTEVISELDASNRVAITKHGKVIAYLVAHIEEEVVSDPSPVEGPQEVAEDVEDQEVEQSGNPLDVHIDAGLNLDDFEFDEIPWGSSLI